VFSWITSSSGSAATNSPADDVAVVLHGELYPDAGPTAPQRCLEAYLRTGTGFVAGLHGSFVLAIADGRQGRVLLVTDPVNSRKLFHGVHDGAAWFSTMHALQWHPCSGAPDPAGIAHCLVNGVPLNGRTPFAGVRVLERGSIHEIRGTRVESDRYWRYDPQPMDAAAAGSLEGDLSDALIGAVSRRLPSEGRVCLSLSGGYDSTAVLGALCRLGVPDVRCFTYRKPRETTRSDASVARRMATLKGHSHTEIPAYEDDPLTVVADNVSRGAGITRLVVETDTWRTLRGLLPPTERTTFWVADVCFGMSPPRILRDGRDALRSLAFGDWTSLGPLRRLFPRRVGAMFDDALRDDLRTMLDRYRAIGDPYLVRDCLYLDQRLQRLLSWREAFAEPVGEVRNPWIDREILELRQYFPIRMSMGKALFKETVRNLFPDLFAVGRAAGGSWHAGHWCREVILTHAEELGQLIRSRPSPLDSLLPPDRLSSLIDGEGGENTLQRLMERSRTLPGRAQNWVRTGGSGKSRPFRPLSPSVDAPVFLLRALVLRELFRERASTPARRGSPSELPASAGPPAPSGGESRGRA